MNRIERYRAQVRMDWNRCLQRRASIEIDTTLAGPPNQKVEGDVESLGRQNGCQKPIGAGEADHDFPVFDFEFESDVAPGWPGWSLPMEFGNQAGSDPLCFQPSTARLSK